MGKIELRNIVYKAYKLYGELMAYYLHLYYKRWCKDIMKRQNIKNKKSVGEEEYVKKWKQLTNRVDPRFYRIFYFYIGNNYNIVPEDISHNIIEHILNPSKYRPYYEDKNTFSKIIPPEFMPATLLRKIKNEFLDSDYNNISITDDQYLKKYLEKYDEIIIKPTLNSRSGKNIDLFEKNQNDEYQHKISRKILSLDYLNSKYKSDFIIQEYLLQSNYLSQFNSSSVNTIRALTYKSLKTNKVVVTSCIMRIGSKGSYVDNAHAGGVFVGINKDGTLGKYAADQYGNKYDSFNGINFKNNTYQIPNFQSILNFASKIGQYIIHHRILQLDIAITQTGDLQLIEFNVSSIGIWLYQFTVSSAFGDYTDEIIEYCKNNKHKIEKVHVSVW